MAATYTASNRLAKQALGSNRQTWGTLGVDIALDLLDQAADGQATVSGVLKTVLGLPDEARNRILLLSGDVVVPNVKKWYVCVNATGAPYSVRTSYGAAATVPPLSLLPVVCDGRDCFTFARPLATTRVLIPSAWPCAADATFWGALVVAVPASGGVLTLPAPSDGFWFDLVVKGGAVTVASERLISPPSPMFCSLATEQGVPLLTDLGSTLDTMDPAPDGYAVVVAQGHAVRWSWSTALSKWVGVGG